MQPAVKNKISSLPRKMLEKNRIFDYFSFFQFINLIFFFSVSEEDHGDSDCICIFVLTHGLSNDMIFAKDVAYKADKIWKPFTADRCKSLAGKPKLFFLQVLNFPNNKKSSFSFRKLLQVEKLVDIGWQKKIQDFCGTKKNSILLCFRFNSLKVFLHFFLPEKLNFYVDLYFW